MPGGRPSKIDQVARHDRQGNPVTFGDEFIAGVRLGLPHDQAAARAGLDRRTVIRWRADAATARARRDLGGKKLTAKESAIVTFCDNLESAEAEAETSRLAIIERAATGGHSITERYVTQRLQDGQMVVVEDRTVTKELAPQWTAAAWWLERRIPARYARRVEVSGPEGGPVPVEERAKDLAEQMEAYLLGAAEARADAPADG